jgi:hypothetical protein
MRAILCVLLLGVIWTADADAQGNSRSARSGRGVSAASRSEGTHVAVDVRFGSEELRLIRTWFGDTRNLEGLPPGLAKRESLPPGLERQLQRNGTLPPGLERKIHRLPVDLEGRLPAPPPGTSRIFIGGRVILRDDASSLILDIAAIF